MCQIGPKQLGTLPQLDGTTLWKKLTASHMSRDFFSLSNHTGCFDRDAYNGLLQSQHNRVV